MPSTTAAARWRTDFRYIWSGETASLFGTQILQLAMPLTAITYLHATPGQLGVLGAVTYLPFLILGLPAGVFVDRWRRRPILVASNLGQMAGIGAVPVLAALGLLTFPLLLTAALVAGFFRVFFTIAYRSYLPVVVPTEQLTYANSRLTASESAAQIAGPGLGGLLIQAIGAQYALVADAVSYLASALSNAAVRRREPVKPRDPTPARTLIADGFRSTLKNPYLRAFAGEAASYNLFWQAVLTLLALFAVRDLGMTPGTLGIAISIGAVGALLGAVATERVANRVGLGRTLVAAVIIGDIAPIAVPFTPSGTWAPVVLAAAFFIQGIGITGCNVHTMVIRQTVTPDHLRGRTNATYLFLAYGIIPVGAVLGGWLGDTIGLRGALAVSTIGLFCTCLFIIFSPARRLRSLQQLVDATPPDAREQTPATSR
ncbi:MFS transporter [Actinoplanes sp. NPDC020271]|uniref:MFS transporter n=1 Tax=Actinoplanes sp. NPDC020271 TaxID=3363896 RepID=UPI00378D5DB5